LNELIQRQRVGEEKRTDRMGDIPWINDSADVEEIGTNSLRDSCQDENGYKSTTHKLKNALLKW
jgi:hypothetical protein